MANGPPSTIQTKLYSLGLGLAHANGVDDEFRAHFPPPTSAIEPTLGLKSPDMLGDLLEVLRDPERRDAFAALIDGSLRHEGISALATTQRFTPLWLAQWLVKEGLKAAHGERLGPCLDPACGGGRLLLEAYRALRARGATPASILSSDLLGFDLDPLAADVASWALWLEAATELGPGMCADLPKPLIFCADERPELMLLGALSSWKALEAISDGRLAPNCAGVVLSNPPYMGSRHMALPLRKALKEQYGAFAGDLYTAFLKRCVELTCESGGLAVLCQQSFLFLKRDRRLRQQLLPSIALREVLHLGAHAFEGLGGEKAAVVAFSATHQPPDDDNWTRFVDVTELRTPESKRLAWEKTATGEEQTRIYRSRRAVERAVAGEPLAYWWPAPLGFLLDNKPTLGDIAVIPGAPNKTANNARFLRYWWEVPRGPSERWIPYAKGGAHQKWYGNLERVVDWSESARAYYANNPTSHLLAEPYWFREGITYSDFGGKAFSARWLPPGSVFDMAGPAIFTEDTNLPLEFWLGFLNAPLVCHLLNADNPTIHYQIDNLRRLPLPPSERLLPDDPSVIRLAALTHKARALTLELAHGEATNPRHTEPDLAIARHQHPNANSLPELVELACARLDTLQASRRALEHEVAQCVESLYGVARTDVAPLDPRYRLPKVRAPKPESLAMDALDFTVAQAHEHSVADVGPALWGDSIWSALAKLLPKLERFRDKRARGRACHPERRGSLWG